MIITIKTILTIEPFNHLTKQEQESTAVLTPFTGRMAKAARNGYSPSPKAAAPRFYSTKAGI